jgi:hypothetical protein
MADPFSKLKLKLGIAPSDSSQDVLLSMYLSDAHDYILIATNLEEVPPLLMPAVIDLAVHNFSRRGDENIKSYSEGGISVTYNDDGSGVPTYIRKQILKFRKLR